MDQRIREKFNRFLFFLCMQIIVNAGVQTSYGQVVISEFMASNSNSLKNDKGEYSDWVELCNAGDSSVNLSGWSISDDKEDPEKWIFPDLVIEPGEFIIIYASDLDIRKSEEPLHLNFKLKASGEYLGLFDNEGLVQHEYSPSFPPQLEDVSFGIPMGADSVSLVTPDSKGHFLKPTGPEFDEDWFKQDFNPESHSWNTSTASIGYETSGKSYQPFILTRIPAPATGVYLRIPFDIEDPETVSELVLAVQSDDGFIAYLNGLRITGFKDPESPKWNSTSTSSTPDRESLIVKQIDISHHIGLLKKSNVLAIHALNNTPRNSDLLWTGHLTARFSNQLFDLSITTPLDEPSPSKANTSNKIPKLSPPEFNPPGGVFEARQTVEILHPDENAEIRFTTNGTLPIETSKLYSKPIPVRGNARIRARAFKKDSKTSDPKSAVFIFKHFSTRQLNSNLPFVILQRQGLELLSEQSFIPVQLLVIPSVDGNSQWEKPDLVENAAIKIRGSSTSNRPKPSLSLEIQDHLGNDLDKPILGMPPDSDWVLWGPFEFDRALMRNPFIYEISRRIGIYAPRTKFVEVFITPPNRSLNNADYFGVYAIIEKIKRGNDRVDIQRLRPDNNSDESITGGYLFKVDRLDPGDRGLSAGGQTIALVDPKEEDITRDQENYLKDYINSFNLSLSRPTQKTFDEYIDVDSWVDHHILNEFTKNPDEFRLSAYMYKPRNGKIFAGPIWDFDRTMGNDSDPRALNPVGWSNWTRYGWYNGLFNKRDFQQSWIDRYQNYRTGPMSTQSMLDLIDSMADELKDAAERNFDKWPSVGPNGNRYQTEVDQLKTWVRRRANWIDSLYPKRPSILNNSGEPEESGFPLKFSQQSEIIYYRLDGLDPRLPGGGMRSGNKRFSQNTSPHEIFETSPITARAKSGIHWSSLLNQVIPVGGTPEIAISEIHYHPIDPLNSDVSSADLEFIELYNSSDSNVQLHGMQVLGGIEFVFPTYSLSPNSFVLLARNPAAIEKMYGVSKELILGPYDGKLSNREDAFRIVDTAGREIISIQYSDTAPWPTSPDGYGSSLEVKDLQGDPLDPLNWKSSSSNKPNPGRYLKEALHVNSVSIVQNYLILNFNRQSHESLTMFFTNELSDSTQWRKIEPSVILIQDNRDSAAVSLKRFQENQPIFIRVSE